MKESIRLYLGIGLIVLALAGRSFSSASSAVFTGP